MFRVSRILFLCIFGILFSGCTLTVLHPSAEAQKVTYLPRIPEGCTFLAEIKAEEGDPQFTGDMVHLSTENIIRNNIDVKLRNTAASFGDAGSVRIVIHKFNAVCSRQQGSHFYGNRIFNVYQSTTECDPMKEKYPNEAFLVYLETYAYIYRCNF